MPPCEICNEPRGAIIAHSREASEVVHFGCSCDEQESDDCEEEENHPFDDDWYFENRSDEQRAIEDLELNSMYTRVEHNGVTYLIPV